MSGFVAKWLEKQNRAHTAAEELEPSKLPALPRAPKHLSKAADVLLGKGARTLSDAVAQVKAGGIIWVLPGEHPGGDPIDTKKPFQLLGAGAQKSAIVFRPKGEDDCLALTAKGKWTIGSLALLAEAGSSAKGVCADVVGAHAGAELEITGCVIAGAPVRIDGDGTTTGGVGVRAYDGAKVRVGDCLVAFNHRNLAAHQRGAELVAKDCQVFAATFGVFAGPGGKVSVSGGEIRRNRYGIKVFGGDAVLDANGVRIEDQTMNGVFLETGRVRLERCSILDNGCHGAGTAAGTELVATGCKVRDNWESGFWVGGKVSIEECEVTESGDHGILLGPESRGRVAKTRSRKNGGFGIVRDPSSKVQLAGNDTKNNERDGDYVFGTLAAALQKGFPRGVRVPEALAKLARFQEEHGRLTGETMYVAPGPLAGWPGLESEFAVFGTGPEGSTVAFWLHDGLGIERAPVVYLDSEGAVNLVLAETFEGFLSILAAGREDLRWDEQLEPAIDDDDEHETFCDWLKEELGVEPAKKISKLRKAAEAKHPGLHARLLASQSGRRER
ncbi:MAG: right-handed parallel beta-helix repeat-containing protein [Polyangiaceae bacterium]|nr:right-handed parallel beta-helix repeat-containing protein [Polyangiaceae bacterium]